MKDVLAKGNLFAYHDLRNAGSRYADNIFKYKTLSEVWCKNFIYNPLLQKRRRVNSSRQELVLKNFDQLMIEFFLDKMWYKRFHEYSSLYDEVNNYFDKSDSFLENNFSSFIYFKKKKFDKLKLKSTFGFDMFEELLQYHYQIFLDLDDKMALKNLLMFLVKNNLFKKFLRDFPNTSSLHLSKLNYLLELPEYRNKFFKFRQKKIDKITKKIIWRKAESLIFNFEEIFAPYFNEFYQYLAYMQSLNKDDREVDFENVLAK